MDEVLEKFSSSAINEELHNEEKSDFAGLYKNWGKLGNQEERRREILEIQKSNRNSKLDQFRGVLELVNSIEQEPIFNKKKGYYRPSIYVAGFNRAPRYNNVLMLSEWMIEKPADFEENWYVVPCPKGVRTLVVASSGTTKFFNKYGNFKFEQRTALPGGNPSEKRSNCCVLDCFYFEKANTVYVLDLLAWNSQPMTDGETEFRHYWLESKLEELPQLNTLSKSNQIIFKLLPKIPCDKESFTKFMLTYPPFENHVPALDGLLFYHKRAHYFAGETPLVGWLYPYMVPEVIGDDIPINKAYELGKPESYVNITDFIMRFEMKQQKRKSKSRKSGSEMEEDIVDDNNETQDSEGTTMETELPSESISEKMDSTEKSLEPKQDQMDSENKEKPETKTEAQKSTE